VVIQISAIVTAFNPDDRLLAVVDAALHSCQEAIVVDNTPSGTPSLSSTLSGTARVRVLRPGRNLGLAGGLNVGVAALAPEATAVLLLDQDSVLDRSIVYGLAAHLADPTVGIAAPSPIDAKFGGYLEPFAASRPVLSDRDVVITSGMLVRRRLLSEFGPFRDEFFVDHVDNDFCLRLRAAGVRIVQDRSLRLHQSLGIRQERKLFGVRLRTSRHPTWRLYWIARNGTVLIREHRRSMPLWSLQTSLSLCRWLLVRGLLESPRRPRIAAALHGFADGIRGRISSDYLPSGTEPVQSSSSTRSDSAHGNHSDALGTGH
jgi:rhamnosyltransferase